MTAAQIRAMLRREHDFAGECEGCHVETELWWDGIVGHPTACRSCWKAEALRAAAQGREIAKQVRP